MDTTHYRDKLVFHDHLDQSIYEVTTQDADKNVFKNQLKLIEKYKKCLTNNEIKFISDYEWKSSNFYVNPKISKCKEILV